MHEVISFRVVLEGEEHLVKTHRHEYRSLMALVRDRLFPEDFGECGGIGRCGTCQVRLNDAPAVAGMDRNEAATLSKNGVEDPLVRLSCQVPVDAALHGATVTLLSFS
ncbi:2Fe-2S iron-sulfur cluster-binding protein [Chitinophaga sp. GCM10012297]|uniref:2Fe-2S iron-sulfur cluster binding domain-containing protein n=1 Tax=Chitinophaga chungangae TaxID=2821488 RepID=A0ABS3YHH2_9BACT|nr:2Fe-2S iron-sulfur cluster-binding protein [Chitinophaga chungangae]MBO9154131.1 2Fe-2S iron-sulfur cluster binding domain-containing protein [Chitinophaga chungangae]